MSILVTGGAGYIESHCVAALIDHGVDAVVVEELSNWNWHSTHPNEYDD